MRKILAAIDSSAAAGPVLATARAMAAFYDASVEAIHVREGDTEMVRAAAERAGVPLRTFAGAPTATLLAAASDDEVVAVVMGTRATPLGKRPAGHVSLEIITKLGKPVVLVPPRSAPLEKIERVLVPLDGTRESAAALGDIMAGAARRIDVVVLHVRDETSIPRFSEQPQYEMDAWSEEFLARHCSDPNLVQLEVRIGSPDEQIVGAIEQTHSGLVALSWGRALAPNRARVVRQCLERSTVPILLVPV